MLSMRAPRSTETVHEPIEGPAAEWVESPRGTSKAKMPLLEGDANQALFFSDCVVESYACSAGVGV